MEERLAPGSFYGETVRSQSAGGFRFAESCYSSDCMLSRHAHEAAFFYFVLQGSSTEVYGNKARRADASTLVFHPAGEPHSNRWHAAGGRCFHLEIAPATLDRLGAHSPVLAAPAAWGGGSPVWLSHRLYEEFRRMDDLSPLAMEGLALEILAEASRGPLGAPERRPPAWLHEARDLLHGRYSESLSLDHIASAVGVHPAHLARVFRQQYRCTVGDYIRQLRVEFACRRLSRSEGSLVEIALAAGFADQSHFSKTFKRLIGMTPAEFRVRNWNTRK
jgi:AraC family transcriptional regulator